MSSDSFPKILSDSSPKIPLVYLGCKAIAQRLGYQSVRMVRRLAEREGLPIYKRRVPIATGGYYEAYAISEPVITAWEIARGRRCVEKLVLDRERKNALKERGLTAWGTPRKRKTG